MKTKAKTVWKIPKNNNRNIMQILLMLWTHSNNKNNKIFILFQNCRLEAWEILHDTTPQLLGRKVWNKLFWFDSQCAPARK